MAKINHNKIKKEILKIVTKYQPILLLQRNTFEIEYPTKNPEALAECACNYPYLNATIRYSDQFVRRYKEKKDISPYIVHEMCHIITDPLYCKATTPFVSKNEIEDERELLTDYICNIVVLNKI